ncbi:MAG: hypothetical protein GQ527_10500 [Bacteroidales bacterium]|nr:hypothetical protein [Bacteroidales bacterium]
MKKISFYSLLIIALIFTSCGATKQTINYDQLAITASENGNYQLAIIEWNNYVKDQGSQNLEVNPKAYAEIAKANFNLENYEEAEIYFDKARDKNYGDADMYMMMSKRYRMIDNLSKEITTLEYFMDHYANSADSSLVRNRLFETSLESENWEGAEKIWSQMDAESKKEEQYLQVYFIMNKKLENTKKCDELAKEILVINDQNENALDWLAKKYYHLAENRYQNSLDSYNKKKSTKTYNILLKELDRATVDFKKSLQYFNVLWKMEDGKKYAKYLANIYARFDDKKKSQYYKGFMKK